MNLESIHTAEGCDGRIDGSDENTTAAELSIISDHIRPICHDSAM